jgi:molybdopterin converting factor small subunit
MSVKILIPALINKQVEGREVVEVDGATVSQCIDALRDRYPGTERWLYKGGKIATYVHVGVNGKVATVDTPVKDGDDIKILIATGGG